jgi:hypothetical protein
MALVGVLAAAGAARAQTLSSPPPVAAAPVPPPPAPAAPPAPPPAPTERFSAIGYGYVVPDAPNFIVGIAQADLAWLHLEGRYQYEALRTGSAFAGVNLGWGHALRLGLTPMAGGMFGRLDGLVPALRWTLTWWRFDLYSESEVAIPFSDVGGSFFYDWTEFGISIIPGIRFGGVVQRNLVFQTSLDVQRGLFAGIHLGPFGFAVYEFNWGWMTPTFVFALSLGV